LSKADTLLELQQIDLTLERLNKRLAEVKAAQRETDAVRAARQARQAADQEAVKQRALRKDLELSAATLDGRIKQAEQRLYSGLVKNPKELVDLQNDVAALKRQKAALDDQLLEAMVTLEEAEAAFKRASDDLVRSEAEWKTSQADLFDEQAQLETDLAKFSGEQSEVRQRLDAASLSLYDQLRRRKNGLAVAEYDDGVCSGCGIQPTSNVINQIRQADQLARCGNCERILVEA
jgi:predicted  nucleic acid-binding Zn-ribbon protein